MNITDRLLPVFKRNYPLEKRDVVWEQCMARSTRVQLTEENLENMCGTKPGGFTLVAGFGGGEGKKEIFLLAEALGLAGIENPEATSFTGKASQSCARVDHLNLDEILDKIQIQLGFPIRFPPFHGNCSQGITTKYGLTTNRHIFYLWVLKRVTELCPDRNAGIIEIGAGFGLLGYYLDQLGYHDYTTIDLALVNVCQTYFLSKNIPGRNLIISGEVENPFDPQFKNSIKLLHSTDFDQAPSKRFDIMINIDGLTEYGIEHAKKYAQSDCAAMLFSINHEVNPYRVCDLEQPHRKRLYRYPFWLRAGYVEELFVPG